MISPKIGGLIIFILPILPLIFSIIYKNTKKQSYFELFFVVAVIVSAFFSYAYKQLLELPLSDREISYYSDFSGQLFLKTFNNMLIPLIYLSLLVIFYFVFYRTRKIS